MTTYEKNSALSLTYERLTAVAARIKASSNDDRDHKDELREAGLDPYQALAWALEMSSDLNLGKEPKQVGLCARVALLALAVGIEIGKTEA